MKPFVRIGSDVLAVAHIVTVKHVNGGYVVRMSDDGAPLAYADGSKEAQALVAWLKENTEDTEYLIDGYQRTCR